MNRISITFLFTIALFTKIYAQTSPIIDISADSVFLIVRGDDRFIYHHVKQGQTLYSICNFYNVNVSDVKGINILNSDNVQPGGKILIPISGKAIIRNRKPGFKAKDYQKVFYKTKEKETLFRVAKVHFPMSVDTLKVRNNLKTDILSLNQVLLIGWINKTGVPDSIKTKASPYAKAMYDLKLKFDTDKAKKEINTQEGAAYWRKNDRSSKNTDFFLLHNEAPRGSVVEVYNPRSKRTIYAKVTGAIPPNENTLNAVAVFSPAAAQALGARDAKFYIKIKYFK